MNFLDQDFQKLEHEQSRHTRTQTDRRDRTHTTDAFADSKIFCSSTHTKMAGRIRIYAKTPVGYTVCGQNIDGFLRSSNFSIS